MHKPESEALQQPGRHQGDIVTLTKLPYVAHVFRDTFCQLQIQSGGRETLQTLHCLQSISLSGVDAEDLISLAGLQRRQRSQWT